MKTIIKNIQANPSETVLKIAVAGVIIGLVRFAVFVLSNPQLMPS